MIFFVDSTEKPSQHIPLPDQNFHDEDDAHDPVITNASNTTELVPYFVNPKKMLKVHVKPAGNMINMKCKAQGIPTPSLVWLKNGEQPLKRSLGNIKYGTWSITLEDLVTDDSGTYTCLVCNRLGCISFNYTLDVVGK